MIFTLIEYHARAFFKSKTAVIAHGLTPLSYILLISIVSRGEFFTPAIVGGIVSFMIGGLGSIPIELSGMKARSKFYYMFLSFPISPLTFALGLSIGLSIPSLPYIIILLAIFILTIGKITIYNLMLLVFVFLSCWIWAALTGLYIGFKLREPTLAMRISSIVIPLLTILPPVYYPVKILPNILHIPALLIPTVSAAYLIRSLYVNVTPYWSLAAAILIIYLLISSIIGIKLMRLKEE